MLDNDPSHLQQELIELFNQCKADPANLNALYTLVGKLTMHVSQLLADKNLTNSSSQRK